MTNKKLLGGIVIGIAAMVGVVILLVASIGGKIVDLSTDKTLDELVKDVSVKTATPTKGTISLEDDNLYDELPEITKYPLVVVGEGDINVEIFTTGEKAGKDKDSFLVEAAQKFNAEHLTTGNGQIISISLRSVSSGLAADYIRSGKYLPDIYNPSNELFGEFAIADGANLDILTDRLVGNTAGVLVKKNSGYSDIKSIVEAVVGGNFNLGYTDPSTSATGLNMLLEILKVSDESNMFSDKAVKAFSDFNKNIPYIAYTTQQMRDSAGKGSFDAIVSEYQAYINDTNLVNQYDFIPFGVRHDNPMYIVDKNSKTSIQLEAYNIIKEYLLSADIQKIATSDGFNANDSYKSEFTTSDSEIVQAMSVYKKNKDSGNDIIAVFVADCSGSMDGDPMYQLKSSLSNGAKYINDNNYIGLVSYASEVTVELPIAQFDFNQRSFFQGAVDGLQATSTTSTYEACSVALDMVLKERENHPNAKCMVILLSDGYANGRYSISTIKKAVTDSQVPIYTIGYGSDADKNELSELSGINEAASIIADSEDIVYKIKSLFNSQL